MVSTHHLNQLTAATLTAILLAGPATAADVMTLELIGAVRMAQPNDNRVSADELARRNQARVEQQRHMLTSHD